MHPCNFCQQKTLKEFLDLGKHPLVNSLLTKAEVDAGTGDETYPLKVSFCENCHLVQLSEMLPSEKIYKDVDYLFFSSDMPTLSDYFKDFADELYTKGYLHKGEKNRDGSFTRPDELMVEIGSNDGVLLQHIEGKKLGVDPATNVAIRALSKGIPTIPEFFTEKIAKLIAKEYGKAQVISGFNCIAHTSDINDLMKGVDALLDKEGVFIVEANYWGGMVKNMNYALIYHDHYNFFTLGVWEEFLKKFGMKVFDAEVTPAQGGSLRLFISRQDSTLNGDTARLAQLRSEEAVTKLNTFETCEKYAEDVKEMKRKFQDMVYTFQRDGKTMALYGVAAKGLTVLTYTALGKEFFKYGVDDSPAKQGYFTPVSHIPIVSRSDAWDYNMPDYFIVLAYNYIDVIKEKEKDFLAGGGHLINIMTLEVI